MSEHAHIEDPKNHQVPPGWITEFVPSTIGDELVLCRGWHAATHQQWFIGVYVHEMVDGRWVMRHDGTEPEFVIAWTPIPGYPYSQSFKERLAEKGCPIYPHVATSSDGMAIEMKAPGYSVVSFGPMGASLRSTAAENNMMAARQRIYDEEVAAMQKARRQDEK